MERSLEALSINAQMLGQRAWPSTVESRSHLLFPKRYSHNRQHAFYFKSRRTPGPKTCRIEFAPILSELPLGFEASVVNLAQRVAARRAAAHVPINYGILNATITVRIGFMVVPTVACGANVRYATDMQDDLDEAVLNVLLAEGLDVPTSVAGATRDTHYSLQTRPLASSVRIVIVLGAVAIAGVTYLLLR